MNRNEQLYPIAFPIDISEVIPCSFIESVEIVNNELYVNLTTSLNASPTFKNKVKVADRLPNNLYCKIEAFTASQLIPVVDKLIDFDRGGIYVDNGTFMMSLLISKDVYNKIKR